MITAIVEFALPKPVTVEEARQVFLGTAPKYLGMPGLLRKYYIRSEDGRTAGGIYLWRSKDDALAAYTDEWKAFVRGKYGSDPRVTFLDCPVVVDNLTHEILSA
jgi:hypothetical protein